MLDREPLPWAHLIPYTAETRRFYAANGSSFGEPFPTSDLLMAHAEPWTRYRPPLDLSWASVVLEMFMSSWPCYWALAGHGQH